MNEQLNAELKRLETQAARGDFSLPVLGGNPLLQTGPSCLRCDQCGERCFEGYEAREYGRDENGYADEEIVCSRCLDRHTTMTIQGDPSHEWDANAVLAFAECFFEYPERIQVTQIRYL